MDTLYDLLGALPSDDAEGLRAAFRRAAKGAHPDINPGDPDAGLRFRQIVRANEILADVEQRAAYDHLLDLARIEEEQAAKLAFADRVYRFASGVMALAALSAATVGGYALFLHLSANATSISGEVTDREMPAIAAEAAPEQAAATAPAVPPDAPARADLAAQTMVPAAATTPAANVGPPLDITPRKAKSYWAQGVSAYRSGDLNGALADFNQAIQSDPKFAPAYIDRGILFYRLHKSAHAFADISHAKRLERASRLARARKKPMRAMADNARPLPPRQTAEVDLSQQPSPVVTRP